MEEGAEDKEEEEEEQEEQENERGGGLLGAHPVDQSLTSHALLLTHPGTSLAGPFTRARPSLVF